MFFLSSGFRASQTIDLLGTDGIPIKTEQQTEKFFALPKLLCHCVCLLFKALKTVHIVAFYQDFVQSQLAIFFILKHLISESFSIWLRSKRKSLSKALKISKFQQHFFLKLHSQKNDLIFSKDFCPSL